MGSGEVTTPQLLAAHVECYGYGYLFIIYDILCIKFASSKQNNYGKHFLKNAKITTVYIVEITKKRL